MYVTTLKKIWKDIHQIDNRRDKDMDGSNEASQHCFQFLPKVYIGILLI